MRSAVKLAVNPLDALLRIVFGIGKEVIQITTAKCLYPGDFQSSPIWSGKIGFHLFIN